MPKNFRSAKQSKCGVGRSAPELNARNSAALANAQRLRSSSRWQKHRANILNTHPLCFDPYGDHTNAPALATDVHHIHPVAQRPDLLTVRTNTVPLCHDCHARIEGEEKRGRNTAKLFLTWSQAAGEGGRNL